MPRLPSPPPATPAWHAMAADAAVSALGTDASLGLAPAEAAHRLATVGENRLPEAAHRPAWRRLLAQFHNPIIYVLIGAGLITLALRDYVDTGVIFFVVLANAVIGFVQEGKAERALDAVRGMLALRATVLRGGERQEIGAESLVPGDVVLLGSGDKVPADMRLLRVRSLRVEESALTGESVAVEKQAGPVGAAAGIGDRACMAHSGTLVAYGQGVGVVVATGIRTELGRIGTLVSEVRTLATPLTRRLDQFARQITVFILAVGGITFLYGWLAVDMPTLDIFLAVVGLAVAAIPEGLPAIVTIILAIGTRAMARKRAIVRQLPAIETLGSVSVVCTDKTGTLTRNEMTVVRVVEGNRELRVAGSGYAPVGGFHLGDAAIDPVADASLQRLARCALLCNDARVARADDGEWRLAGDPTEGALITLGLKAGLDPQALAQRLPRLDVITFESERQYMATLHHDHHGQHVILLKGAPERVLRLCSRGVDGTALDHDEALAAVERAASNGERVLALAECVLPVAQETLALDDITPRFTLLGLVGIIDPPREEAIAAVAEFQRAGIRVKMITGDHGATACAIARQLGIGADTALTGEAIRALDDAGLRRHANATDVIARASPEDKLRLVAALQAEGHQVAMTGDGVNDAPALKAADIGVAMGHKGTDAAREASDIVLTDDNFATIARAVREGRTIYDNIKKSLLFALPTNGGEAGVILIAIFAGLALPVTPGQILWVNTVTAVTLALALAFEPAEAGVMSEPPRSPREPLITRALAARVLYVSALMAAATFITFQWELGRGSSLETARTAATNMLVAGEIVYLFNVRHFTASALNRSLFEGNRVAFAVSGLLVVIQLLFTYAPPLQVMFQTRPLDAVSWWFIVALATAKFLAVEAEKAAWRRFGVHRM